MKVTVIGDKSRIYIDPVNNNAVVDYEKSINFKNVKMFGVNHLIIRRTEDGTMKIVQAGGYNRFRGLFTDLYD